MSKARRKEIGIKPVTRNLLTLRDRGKEYNNANLKRQEKGNKQIQIPGTGNRQR